MIKYLFSRIAEFKVYFNNSAFYVSFINFIILLATFKKVYDIQASVFIIAPLGIALIIFLGWLDYNFIYKSQIEYVNKKNDIKIQLDRIESCIGGRK